MTIVAIGKSSFLAQEVAKHPGAKDWLFMQHEQALAHPGWMDKATVIVNFAFAPQFKKQVYDTQADFDSFLAKMLGGRDVRYIMLSSRMVYGQGDHYFDLTEDHACEPISPYGMAKHAVERALERYLGDRLTILRMGNIFGVEKERATFFGQMIKGLKDDRKIVFDMSAETKRDFLPAHRFADALTKVAAAPAAGIFNIGSGLATPCGDVAGWLIEGFGAGKLQVVKSEIRDQFSLDVSKAQAQWNIPAVTRETLGEDVINCGKKLK
jgi:nucleoside-diphosphate-sugar epimerase